MPPTPNLYPPLGPPFFSCFLISQSWFLLLSVPAFGYFFFFSVKPTSGLRRCQHQCLQVPTQGLHVQCQLFKYHTFFQPGNFPNPMSLIVSYDCWFVIWCFRSQPKNRSLLVLSCSVKLGIKFTFSFLHPSLQDPILKRWVKSSLGRVGGSYWVTRVKHGKLLF